RSHPSLLFVATTSSVSNTITSRTAVPEGIRSTSKNIVLLSHCFVRLFVSEMKEYTNQAKIRRSCSTLMKSNRLFWRWRKPLLYECKTISFRQYFVRLFGFGDDKKTTICKSTTVSFPVYFVEMACATKRVPSMPSSNRTCHVRSQGEAMLKHYKVPVLLITFNPNK
ncbi:unnamed protein product, partial [Ectocarpus fasciculatus]